MLMQFVLTLQIYPANQSSKNRLWERHANITYIKVGMPVRVKGYELLVEVYLCVKIVEERRSNDCRAFNSTFHSKKRPLFLSKKLKKYCGPLSGKVSTL